MFGIAPWKNRQLLLYLFGSKNLLVFFDLSFRSRSQKEQNLLLKKKMKGNSLGNFSLSLSQKLLFSVRNAPGSKTSSVLEVSAYGLGRLFLIERRRSGQNVVASAPKTRCIGVLIN